MKRLLFLLLITSLLITPVAAIDFTAPQAPDSVENLMPAETETFTQGLWKVIKAGIRSAQPNLAEACGVCICLIALILLISLVKTVSSAQMHVIELAAALAISGILLQRTNSMIHLAARTVREVSEYSKLLLPVMTAALAAQGGTTTSSALYTATAFLNSLLANGVATLLVPMVYVYLGFSVAASATISNHLSKLRDTAKWLMTWLLKIILYVFTGYMGITGVISGTVDAAAVKATKLTISGMVPVVGNILSDASEAVLVGASVVKNAVGVYGMLAIIAICIAPFLEIGCFYLLLKVTAALCGCFDTKKPAELIQGFSSGLGLLLAMTGTVCLMLLISTVCFMKGVG